MASGGVKLSILSTYDNKGTEQAEKALEKFAKRYGTLNQETGAMELGATASALAQSSVKADQMAAKLERVSAACATVGGALTKGVTVPIAVTAGAAVKASMDMESAFANVRKTLDTSEEGYSKLYDAAVNMSTVHPIAATEVANVMALGAQLGIAEENLTGFAETVYGLDIATDLDTESAATNMAQFANICGTAQDQLSNVGSTVVALGNTSATTESTIMDMGMRIAAAGSQAGMSEANILAISAALASVGMEAEAGGTAMSTTISQINKDVATNGEHLETWAQLAGTSVEEFKAAWSAGGDSTTRVFADIVQGMAQTSDEGGNLTVILEELGITGIRQSDAMQRLAGAGDLLTSSIDTANEAYAENTALSNEVANFEDTLANKFEVTKNKVVAAGIQMGGPLLDSLSGVIDASQPLIDSLTQAAQAFADMDADGQRTVLTVLAVAAAAGPVITAFGKVAGAGATVLRVYADVTSAMALWAQNAAKAKAAAAATASGMGRIDSAAASLASKLSLAKVGVAGLAAVATLAIATAADYIRKQKEAEQATDGLRNAQLNAATVYGPLRASMQQMADETERAADSSGQAASGFNAYSSELTLMKTSVDDATAAQAQLAEKVGNTFADAYTSQAMIDGYAGTIESLANRSNLSAQEQAKLQSAVDGLNEACGTSYSVLDAENGILADQAGKAMETTEEIQKLAEAKKIAAMEDALNSAYADSMRQQQDAAVALAEALENQRVAHERMANSQGASNEELQRWRADMESADAQVQKAQANVDSLAGTTNGYTGQLTLLQMAQDQGAGSNAKWLADQSAIGAIMTKNGQDVSAFAQQLDDAGVHMSDFGDLSSVQISALAQAYDGGLASIAAACLQNGIEIPQSLRDGILSGQGGVTSAASALTDALVLEMTGGDVAKAAELLGHDIDEGLRNGIEGNGDMPAEAIGVMSEQTIQRAKEAWQSHSPSQVMHQLGLDIDTGLGNGITAGQGAPIDAIGALGMAMQTGFSTLVGTISQGGSQLVGGFASAIIEGSPLAQAAASLMGQGAVAGATTSSNAVGAGWALTNTARAGIGSIAGQAASMAFGGVTAALGSSNASGAGRNMSATFATSINGFAGAANARSMANRAEREARNASDASGAGRNLSSSFAQGIDVSAAVDRAASLARNALQAAKDALGINSPSREFRALGYGVNEGFVQGIDRTAATSAASARAMAEGTIAAAQSAMSSVLSLPVGIEPVGALPAAASDNGDMLAALSAQQTTLLDMLFELRQLRRELPQAMRAMQPAETSEREKARYVQRLVAMNV